MYDLSVCACRCIDAGSHKQEHALLAPHDMIVTTAVTVMTTVTTATSIETARSAMATMEVDMPARCYAGHSQQMPYLPNSILKQVDKPDKGILVHGLNVGQL